MDLERILKVAVRGGASDIILKNGAIPKFRFQGELVPLSDGQEVSQEMLTRWLDQIVPNHLKPSLGILKDLDFSYELSQGYRFRVNVFRQRQSTGMVFRVVNQHIRTVEELQLPEIIAKLAFEKRGLILVTGATGSGKSTTLAAIIEKINQSRSAHILTIEDPIEFQFKEKKATINQREIGIDTPSFAEALRSALRQNPDVIFVGELRDQETTETAIMAAETGHLVLATLHTVDAVETLGRLLSYFEPHRHQSLKQMISQTLRAVISQRLVIRNYKQGMVAALEILIVNELVREQIAEGKNLEALKEAIRSSRDTYGMQSFDQALLALSKQGIISQKVALDNASNRKDFELLLQGIGDA